MTAGELITALAPEFTLIVGAVVVLLLGLARSPAWRGSVGFVSFLFVLAALGLTWSLGLGDETARGAGFRVGPIVLFVRSIGLGLGLIVLLMHGHLSAGGERGELFSMILFSLAGILLTSLADDVVLLFLAIELVSVPTYVMVSMARGDIRSPEAGVKYFFLGAMAAAMLAYGLSFLYGAAGTTTLSDMYLADGGSYVTLGLVLAFAGLAFKVVAVPFHAYAADVYQGAASPVTGLLGLFPKLAGFVAMIRIFSLSAAGDVGEAVWTLPEGAFWFLWIVAAATMTVGNVLALVQSNVKRILAYSSIAHSGYMLVGVAAGPVSKGGPFHDGSDAMLFYMAAYGFMNLGVFAVLSALRSRGKETEELADLSGLARRHPWAALGMVICLLSLMGFPPMAGFWGKVYVFSSALSAGAEHHPFATGLIALAVVGVINSAIAAAYYLRIIAVCCLGEPDTETELIQRPGLLQVAVACCWIAVLLIGVWPEPILLLLP